MIVLAVLALVAVASSWTIVEAIATVLGVILAVGGSVYTVIRMNRERRETVEEKLDSLTLAMVGRPPTKDGIPKIPGLVDDFKTHRDEVIAHQRKVDQDIVDIQERLEDVAMQYVTNGGGTIKDDLLVVRSNLAKLSNSVQDVIATQADVANELAESKRVEK